MYCDFLNITFHGICDISWSSKAIVVRDVPSQQYEVFAPLEN